MSDVTTHPLRPLSRLRPEAFEGSRLLRKAATAARQLAELKGVVRSIPNEAILINTLGLQEAKDSSAIENIVTTHDELFRADVHAVGGTTPAAKEVRDYARALHAGFILVRDTGLLTTNHLLAVQAEIEHNNAGLRKLPGTTLRAAGGRVVYTPPQDEGHIVQLMRDLERFINDDAAFDADPLVKMAIAHHQFESIHPFYDGNGRTGRILNVLYLVRTGLLDLPVLYLSNQILRTRPDYYRLLQRVREEDDSMDAWAAWVAYMLDAVEITAADTIRTVTAIRSALLDYKHRIRDGFRFYSQDLINNLFMHPYTKIEFVERDLGVSRLTATKYLDALAAAGLVDKIRKGRSNYYVNRALGSILMQPTLVEGAAPRARL